MSYCVYKHSFPNGKIYIGITSTLPCRRWHRGLGYKEQPYIFHAILKYGWDNIKHEILFDGLTKEEAEEKEIELIAMYKSNQRDFGYNIANGGNSTGMMSEDTKRRISNTLKGRNAGISPFKGKKHKLESRMLLSSKRKGSMNPMYGKKISEETRAKMSEAHKKGALCKRVLCVETGQIFVSVSEAARQMKLSQGNVGSVARGKRENTKGYHFKYLEEKESTNGIQT